MTWSVCAPHRLFVVRLCDDEPSGWRAQRCFEMVFFAGIAVHFGPYLVHYGRFLGEGNGGLLDVVSLVPASVPSALLVGGVYFGCALGMAGAYVRGAALLVLVSLQSLLHRNSAAVLTLAVSHAFTILLLMVLGGGADRAWRGSPAGSHTPRAATWTRTLIVYSTLLGVFFSGLEKLASRWSVEHPMRLLLGFPPDHLVRSWALALLGPQRDWVAKVLEYGTLAFELTAPLLLAVTVAPRRLIFAWLGFFAGVLLVLEVPVLFLTTYGFAVVLVLRARESIVSSPSR